MDRQALPSQGCGFGELRGERMIARRRLAGATVQVVVAATLAARKRSLSVWPRLVDLTFPEGFVRRESRDLVAISKIKKKT